MKTVFLFIFRMTILIAYLVCATVFVVSLFSLRISDRTLLLVIGTLVFVVLGELLELKRGQQ